MNSGNCKCFACFSGRGCDMECSDHGKCQGNKCVCHLTTGWRGSLCEVPGCPGVGKDCTGHGTCDSVNHKCICNPGNSAIIINLFVDELFCFLCVLLV